MINAICDNALILAVFALITAGLLAGTYLGTKDRIAASERKVAQRALLEVVPRGRHDNDMLNDTLPIPEASLETLGLASSAVIHIARRDGQPVAVIVPATAPDGYSGDIDLIVGVNTDGSVAGVRIISHSETPGLGDKVDTNKSDWVFSFDGKSLGKPAVGQWKVKKDQGVFDQFTGATITPRAVVNQVKKVLLYFEEDRGRLLAAAQQASRAATGRMGTSDGATGNE